MMRWFKRKRKITEEPRFLLFATEAGAQEWLEQKLATGEPMFISKHTEDGATYETYHGSDAEVAKTFLMNKRVDRDLYYIVVETPEGNWGTDVEGLYLEKLLSWQLDTSAADCVGQIHSVTNLYSLAMSARGFGDNYVVKVQCGQCAHLWHDGLRYQDETLVRCPNCEARNNVDSSGVAASDQQERQLMVITSTSAITDESWRRVGGVEDKQEVMLAGVDEVITTCRHTLAGTPPGHPHLSGRLSNLGFALRARFERTGQLGDLDEAITAFREAVATTPAEDPDRPRRLSTLGVVLRDRFERTGRLGDLDNAVAAGRDAVTATPSNHLGRHEYLTSLAATLRVRFEHTGQLGDLDEAIAAARDAVVAALPDHPDHLACRATLGLALQERFGCTGHLADLEEAITAFMDAVAATPPDHSQHSGHQHNLSRALLARFQRTGQLADVDGAIAAARDAIAATTPHHPNHVKYLTTFGATLQTRFGRTGHLADLDKAVAAAREAVASTPREHSDHPLYLAGLGSTLQTRFGRTGQLNDLNEAIDAVRDALDGTSSNHPDRAGYLDTLGVILKERFTRTGQLVELDEAINADRDAVAATSPGHPNYPRRLSNLGAALGARFQRIGHLADLDESTTAYRDAVAATPPDHPDRHAFISNLGAALINRFELSSQRSDLDEAIAADREAVAAIPPDHPDHPGHLSSLGVALRIRYQRTGQTGDLDEAIAAGRDAVSSIPFDHPGRAGCLFNLSVALDAQFERTGEPADLDYAVAAARDAVATTPLDHPDCAEYLLLLGVELQSRFKRTGQQADLEEAITTFMDAANVESGPPAVRMRAGRAWGRAAIDEGRIDSAADGFASAVELLPLVAWHGLPRATREEHIAEWSGLAADAAACSIRAGRAERAVELLEAGRSVLWAQTFNLRTDLTDLAEWDPDLATRLDEIRSLLDTALPATPARSISAGAGDPIKQLAAAQSRVVEDHIRLARDFDNLVGQVRAVDGFEHFLEPTSFTQLRAAASGGPVVVVNTSRYGCHALLVANTSVQVLDLPNLTRPLAVVQANTLLGILGRTSQTDRQFIDREKDRHAVLDILGWLWDTITEPILTTLGYTNPPAPGTAWPRIWWCPTGRLTLLPLHAAGHHHRHHRPDNPHCTDTVPDRVISSYTPTLTALLRARATSAPAGRPTLLAIGMPTTSGADDLPAVPAELDRVHARYPIATRLQSPAPDGYGPSPDPGNEPTLTRVLAELPRHTWVHLSCHGSQHFSDPAASAFWLTDGPLRIADLIQTNAGSRELAFLSACQTATGGLRTVDETIHLAAAMQLLGYRHVIAALWSIYDSLAPAIADTVYATLTTTGTPGAALALHHSVAALRAQHPTDPLAWAPYLHTGP